ncbi:MAG: pentapeptide repeat-containing protein, partial [Alphaproteobacteria bacterium]|nr:pentapeptide repeat-containing protein [Alphaproteobacteria bacterium]
MTKARAFSRFAVSASIAAILAFPAHAAEALAVKNLVGADLKGAALANADLTGADLRGANLANAVLDGARLVGAN